LKPDLFRVIVKNAAAKIYYPQCIQYIEMSLPVEFHDLAKSTLPYYLPSQILTLKTVEQRRDAIDSIPDDAKPSHTKSLVKLGVRSVWNREKKATKYG
tara:strand:- start:1490 stop:1783 length:294 start_codon:yes stop_codon:yes gene_type:complete